MVRSFSALAAAVALLSPHATTQDTDELAQVQRAAVTSGAVRVLGEPVRGHRNLVQTVDISPDETRCVSSHWDGVARIWDLPNGPAPLELRGHDGVMLFAYFAVDGTRVVTSGNDQTLRLFDAKTGTELKTVELEAAHQGRVSPDGARLASSDLRADEVEIRNVADLEVVQRVPFAGSLQTQYAWSPDSRFLVIGGAFEPKLVVWDTEAERVVSELKPPGGITSIAVRRDGNALAVGGYDQLATFPFPTTGTEPADSVSGMDSSVRGLIWKDSRTLIFGDDDGGISCLELDGPSLIWSIAEHREVVQDLAVAPKDGAFFASGSHDQTVRFWSTADGSELFQIEGNRDMIRAIAWSKDGGLIAAGDYGNQIAVYDAKSGAVRSRVLAHDNSVVAVIVGEGPRVASAAQDDTLLWVDPSGGDEPLLMPLLSEDLPVMIGGAFAVGRVFAGAFEDGAVRIYNAADGVEIATIAAHDDEATDVAWSADGQLLASTGSDGTIKLWKADGTAVATVASDLIPDNEVCFAGDRIVAGDPEGMLRIYTMTGGEAEVREINVATEDGEAIQELCASADGAIVAALSAWRITLWSTATGELLGETDSYISVPGCGVFSPDGTELAVGMIDSTVLVWDVAKLRGD